MPMFTSEADKLAFARAPKRLVMSIEPCASVFLGETGFEKDGHDHHEVTRQVFDAIANVGDFDEYTRFLANLPLITNLYNYQRYEDSYGRLSDAGRNLRAATLKYGGAIYMCCVRDGLFLNGQTPYICETIKGENILLYNTAASDFQYEQPKTQTLGNYSAAI